MTGGGSECLHALVVPGRTYFQRVSEAGISRSVPSDKIRG